MKNPFKRKSKIFRNFTPPTVTEIETILGYDDSEPFRAFRYADLMKSAMACKVYDRTGAFERLHSIRRSNDEFKESERRLKEMYDEAI